MRLKMNERVAFLENMNYAYLYVERIELRFYFVPQPISLYETNTYQVKQTITAVADYSS